jgi:hypothetical protein
VVLGEPWVRPRRMRKERSLWGSTGRKSFLPKVPYVEREEAKALGARWDAVKTSLQFLFSL